MVGLHGVRSSNFAASSGATPQQDDEEKTLVVQDGAETRSHRSGRSNCAAPQHRRRARTSCTRSGPAPTLLGQSISVGLNEDEARGRRLAAPIASPAENRTRRFTKSTMTRY